MKIDKKRLPPFELEIDTYKKLQKIIAKYSDERIKFVSVREALTSLIEEKYEQISGSIKW
ncbi:hypothetical protein H8D04_01070 [bacterium]|nr:hypothetical protein [bacterium]